MAERPVSILIVDDDMDILKMLKEVLTKKGWKAFIAPTGEAAMANMASEKIDIEIAWPGPSMLAPNRSSDGLAHSKTKRFSDFTNEYPKQSWNSSNDSDTKIQYLEI